MHEAEQVIQRVLRDLREGAHRGVVVDSPPGRRASRPWWSGPPSSSPPPVTPLMIVAQTNEQVDDLIDRLGRKAPELRVGRLSATDYRPAERVPGTRTVRVAAKVADLGGPAVTIGTAAKWATVTEGTLAVGDRRRGVPDALGRAAARGRAVRAGAVRRRPGQLDPFSTVETFRWTGPDLGPDAERRWRCCCGTTRSCRCTGCRCRGGCPPRPRPVVSAAFYPFTGFRAGTGPADRALTFTEPGPGDAYDAGGGGGRRDRLGAARAAGPAHPAYRRRGRRGLRGAGRCGCWRAARSRSARHAPGGAPVTADRIAIGAAHRDQVAAIRVPAGRGRARASPWTPPTGSRAGSTT